MTPQIEPRTVAATLSRPGWEGYRYLLGTNVMTARRITTASAVQRADRQDVEVHRHQVPERGEAQEVAVVGLDVDLAEPVGAGGQGEEEPGLLAGREEVRPPDQEQGQAGVGLEVDQVVEPAAVEAGDDLLDPDHAGEGAVGGVDDRGREHQAASPSGTRRGRRGRGARRSSPRGSVPDPCRRGRTSPGTAGAGSVA